MLEKPRKRKMSQSSDDNEKKPKRPRKTSSKVNACESGIVKICWILFSLKTFFCVYIKMLLCNVCNARVIVNRMEMMRMIATSID